MRKIIFNSLKNCKETYEIFVLIYYLKQNNVAPHPLTTLSFFFLIRLQRKISFDTSFIICKIYSNKYKFLY